MGISKRWMAIVITLCMLLGVAGLGQAGDAPKKLTLKLQAHLIPDDTKRTMAPFADAVSALSEGQIEIKLFGVGAIVPMQDVLNAVGARALDMALIAEGYWHKLIPVSEVAGLPFAFRDNAEAQQFMFRRGFGEMLKEGYAKHNVYHIPYETYPVGIMTKKPIVTAEDFKGMKIRAYGVMAEWLNALGTSTTYIPGGELYTALATGVVDGAHWGDAGPMYIMKFHEVLKNYMMPEPIVGAWNNLIINMDLWKSLTPVQQKIIETAAMGLGDFSSTVNTRVLSKTSLNKMISDWGVKVNTVNDAEVEKMMKAATEVWDKVAKKDPMNAKAIAMQNDFLKELGYMK